MATGVLPLLMGKFTRLAQYFSSAEKSYTRHHPLRLRDRHLRRGRRARWARTAAGVDSRAESARRQARFHGEMEQMPPPFSAKKIAGTPAYKLARAGKPVELKPATIRIRSLQIVALEGAEASFAMSISAGGYVRSVAHELGQDLAAARI